MVLSGGGGGGRGVHDAVEMREEEREVEEM